MHIRPAKPDDLRGVMNVLNAGLAADPLWKAFFSLAARQDEDYRKTIESVLEKWLDPANKDWLVSVVELSETDPVIASVAIWDMSGAEGNADLIPTDSTNKYVKKLGKLNHALTHGRRQYMKSFPNYMFLQVLVTHPEHRQAGLGRALCKAGIEVARNKEVSVITLAGSTGYIFCSGLGFRDQGAIDVDETAITDEFNVKAMSYDPSQEPRRGSIVDSLWNYIST